MFDHVVVASGMLAVKLQPCTALNEALSKLANPLEVKSLASSTLPSAPIRKANLTIPSSSFMMDFSSYVGVAQVTKRGVLTSSFAMAKGEIKLRKKAEVTIRKRVVVDIKPPNSDGYK